MSEDTATGHEPPARHGLAGGRLLTRFMGNLLYGVGAADPVTYGVVALTLAGVAGIATAGPARRAARVEPVRVLRSG